MPIYVPGKRGKNNRPLNSNKRTLVATLSLTAMVDMFTVLVVFLLQNYKTTGEVIYLHKDVEIPMASETRELKPASVVTVSKEAIRVEKDDVATFIEVKEQSSWMINNLYLATQKLFEEKEIESRRKLQETINVVVQDARNSRGVQIEDFRRITLQADKEIDFLTIKKVMYTLTEAGATEINFAVIQGEMFDESIFE